jgi:hypothetical protein
VGEAKINQSTSVVKIVPPMTSYFKEESTTVYSSLQVAYFHAFDTCQTYV